MIRQGSDPVAALAEEIDDFDETKMMLTNRWAHMSNSEKLVRNFSWVNKLKGRIALHISPSGKVQDLALAQNCADLLKGLHSLLLLCERMCFAAEFGLQTFDRSLYPSLSKDEHELLENAQKTYVFLQDLVAVLTNPFAATPSADESPASTDKLVGVGASAAADKEKESKDKDTHKDKDKDKRRQRRIAARRNT